MKSKYFLRYLVPICLLLIAFGLRVYRFAKLGTPADEGAFAAAAARLVAGDLLYRDLFWNHTPGIILLMAATFRISGSDLLLSRLLTVGAAMLTVASLMLASRQLDSDHPTQVKPGSPWCAHLVAGLLFACAPLSIFWSRFSMMENFETAFATLSIVCALRGLKKQTGHWWLLAGAMSGIALLFKISALTLVGTIGLFLGIWWLMKRRREPIRNGLLFIAGFALTSLPLLLMLLAQGTMADFLRFLSGVDRLAPLHNWRGKLSALLDWSVKRPFVPLALLGGLFALLSRRAAYLLLFMWAGAETVTLLLARKVEFGWCGYSHYALPVIAAVSLLAGGGLGWAWQATMAKRRLKLALTLLALLLSVGPLPGLGQDLKYVVYETTYPPSGFAAEKEIGQALALVTPNREPIQVFANGVFYHRANRPPANRYFLYPGYLPTSSLAAESEKELIAMLEDPDVGAVLLSGAYTRRLPQSVLDTLFRKWVPASKFSYPYQSDVTLYLPRQTQKDTADSTVTFERGILLEAFEVDVLASDTLLVRLDWSATSPLDENYSVFTHLVGPDGTLVTQHDSWPAIGLRPTVTWQPEELIVDYHWLELPATSSAGSYELRIGLYQTKTGQRLSVQTADRADASFVATRVQLGPHREADHRRRYVREPARTCAKAPTGTDRKDVCTVYGGYDPLPLVE